ncbi:MAG: glutamate--tRNA ligase, partial [Bacteroidota bacterium]
MSTTRVRFAPSPTGPLHIGGLRTALFNYLFARKNNGQFILRIEDTDQNRTLKDAEQYIVDSLNWIGIPFDEGPGKATPFGPYKQSERKHLYQQHAKYLIDNGQAYYAFDTPEVLHQHRLDHEKEGKTFIYNWHNRDKLTNSLSLTAQQTAQLLADKTPYVIRFKTPVDQNLILNDIIRGSIPIDTSLLDDKILFKSDGMPTYHLANVVDDHLMQITHVIRGEEWLPSLALHYLLYQAFNWDIPKFAHLPLILKPTGKGKLSKRDGEIGGFPVYPLSWKSSSGFKENGYFPESVINFLALLGWNPGTEQEIFNLKELETIFSLERVNKSPAKFDPAKTQWFNQQWLQRKRPETLFEQYFDILKNKSIPPPLLNENYITAVIALIKNRAHFVNDFWDLSHYFFERPKSYNPKHLKKHWKSNTSEILLSVSNALTSAVPFESNLIEKTVKSFLNDEEIPIGKAMIPLRLSLVGDLTGPDLFSILEILGIQESQARIQLATQGVPKTLNFESG